MAGQLTIDSLKASSGVLATQNGMTGIAKAWVNFNGGYGNTAGVINGSFNVSSITVNGTGDYTVNYTNAMPNANYAVASNGRFVSNAGASLLLATGLACYAGNPSTTYARVLSGYGNNSNLYNFEIVTVAVFGD